MQKPWAGGHRLWRGGLVLASGLALACHAQESEAAHPIPSLTDSAPSPAAAPARSLENWLDALAFAESGNRERLVHRDRDGQLYYGCLQFSERTFRVYARRFHLLPKGKRSATMRRIYDCTFQKRLAALMIRNVPGSWRNWRRTVETRVGMPPVDAGTDGNNRAPEQ